MICAHIVAGALVVDDPQPATYEACTVVLPSGVEIGASPFFLSVSDASLVGAAIVGVWGVAWAFKALFLTVEPRSNEDA